MFLSTACNYFQLQSSRRFIRKRFSPIFIPVFRIFLNFKKLVLKITLVVLQSCSFLTSVMSIFFNDLLMILTIIVLVHVLIQVWWLPRSVSGCRWRWLGPVLAGTSCWAHGNAVIWFHSNPYANSDFLAHRRWSTTAARQHRRVHLFALCRSVKTSAMCSLEISLEMSLSDVLLSSQTSRGSTFNSDYFINANTILSSQKLKYRHRIHLVLKEVSYLLSILSEIDIAIQ